MSGFDANAADAWFERARHLVESHRLGEAAQAFREGLLVRWDDARALAELARVCQVLGDHPSAVDAFERAIVLRSKDATLANDLGSSLAELGRTSKAQAAFERAIALDPSFAIAHANRANVLFDAGHAEEAFHAYARAIALDPRNVRTRMSVGLAYEGSGRFEEAETEYRSAHEIDPLDAEGCVRLANALLRRGRGAEARALAETFLQRRPGHSLVLAFHAVLLRELGDIEEARRLLDYDRFVRTFRLGVEDTDALSAFHAALEAEVLGHPSLMDSPYRHATRGGKHTGHLWALAEGALAHLEEHVGRAVSAYWRAIDGSSDHPFVRARPDRVRLHGWAVVLEAGGYQLPHVHPDGWLSGVHYVKVPSVVRADALAHEGWLEFGLPDPALAVRAEPEVRKHAPVEGTLVLFPSYFYHRTIPYEGEGRRISVAFDVLPMP